MNKFSRFTGRAVKAGGMHGTIACQTAPRLGRAGLVYVNVPGHKLPQAFTQDAVSLL